MIHENVRVDSPSARADRADAAKSQSSPTLLSDADLDTVAEQAKLVRRLQRARSRRTDFLSSSLFGEPAWDMLLELFVSTIEQKRVTVSALCIASNVPQTTALRWIDVLVKEELVTRRSDPLHGRRIHLELTPSAYCAMRDYARQLSGALRAA